MDYAILESLLALVLVSFKQDLLCNHWPQFCLWKGADAWKMQAKVDRYHAEEAPLTVHDSLIGWGENPGPRLVGVFLMTIGNNCTIPSVIAFLVNNIPSSSKRQIALPLQGGFAGIGGIAGALIFRTRDVPKYLFGLYMSIAFACCCILMISSSVAYFYRENLKADGGDKLLEGIEGFRYTL